MFSKIKSWLKSSNQVKTQKKQKKQHKLDGDDITVSLVKDFTLHLIFWSIIFTFVLPALTADAFYRLGYYMAVPVKQKLAVSFLFTAFFVARPFIKRGGTLSAAYGIVHTAERVTGRDIDGDGYVGRPTSGDNDFATKKVTRPVTKNAEPAKKIASKTTGSPTYVKLPSALNFAHVLRTIRNLLKLPATKRTFDMETTGIKSDREFEALMQHFSSMGILDQDSETMELTVNSVGDKWMSKLMVKGQPVKNIRSYYKL